MFNRESFSNLHFLYLLIGVVSFLIIGADVLLKLNPTVTFQVGLSNFWRSVFLAWFFIGQFLYFTEFFEGKEIFNIEHLLRYAFLTGLGVVALYFFLEYLPSLNRALQEGFGDFGNKSIVPASSTVTNFIKLLRFYSFVIYFLVALVLYKKLVYVKKTKQEIILWNIFKFLLILAPIFSFTGFKIPFFLVNAYLSVGLVLVLFLVVRMKWIALLTIQEKWRIIALLVFNNLAAIFLAIQLSKTTDLYILQVDIIRNVFLILIVGMVLLYGVVSLLALIFNLPVAAVMEERNEEINSFQEINQIIQGKFKPDLIFEKLFNISYSNTKAEAGWIEFDNEQVREKIFSQVNITDELINAYTGAFEKSGTALTSLTHFHISDLKKDAGFKMIKSNFRSLLYFPITTNKKIVGRFFLLKTYSKGFDEYMVRMVKTYIDQTSLAIKNSELIDEVMESERLKEELEIAKKVQIGLLPGLIPENKYFDLSCYSNPALEVGGDYYDFYKISDSKYVLIIGDVSGKGTTAAFHMAEMKGIFQALIQTNQDPKEFMEYANNALSNCLDKNAFIALAYFYVDCKKNKIYYSRAGQCPVLYYNAAKGKLNYLEDKGIALGIIRDGSFKDHLFVNEISFGSKDFIVLFTDGIIESRNESVKEQSREDFEYGYDRLFKITNALKSGSAESINAGILDDVQSFIKGPGRKRKTDQPNNIQVISFDDITLITLKFK